MFRAIPSTGAAIVCALASVTVILTGCGSDAQSADWSEAALMRNQSDLAIQPRIPGAMNVAERAVPVTAQTERCSRIRRQHRRGR